eukprot:GHUV01018579.1.p1 GENE.GHUV01018579.1~~GHUV01018579.1.p1  ORF type:complete len:107 (-),score=5.91 GHUV01018579.1:770-1090(-)
MRSADGPSWRRPLTVSKVYRHTDAYILPGACFKEDVFLTNKTPGRPQELPYHTMKERPCPKLQAGVQVPNILPASRRRLLSLTTADFQASAYTASAICTGTRPLLS